MYSSLAQCVCVVLCCVVYRVSYRALYVLRLSLSDGGEYSLASFVDDGRNVFVPFVPLACLLACLLACRLRARPWGLLANLVGAAGSD